MSNLKSKCCKRYQRKPKACSRCPVFAVLSKGERKRALRHARKKAKS